MSSNDGLIILELTNLYCDTNSKVKINVDLNLKQNIFNVFHKICQIIIKIINNKKIKFKLIYKFKI